MNSLYSIDGQELHLHLHPGQEKAWQSTRRFVSIISGSGSGKTAFAPIWLWREMGLRGPGDYGFVSPTFTLMEIKALPEFLKFFRDTLHLGDYVASPIRKFTVSPEAKSRLFGTPEECLKKYGVPITESTHVYFGYAENPESLESSTLKGVVLDEAGQKGFRRQAWEALIRRVAAFQGRILIGTTPYSAFGWLRTEIVDRAQNGDPDIELIQFDSTTNPAYPKAEFERARKTLPAWKFDLFYRGIMTKPAGLIYNNFDRKRHVIEPFPIPRAWPKYLGLDFGGVNTAALYITRSVDNMLYVYKEYHAGEKSAKEHAMSLLEGESGFAASVGGSHSEGQWRREFAQAGLHVREPVVRMVEVGIDRVYALFAEDKVKIFGDKCERFIEELETYSRELNDHGEATEKIQDKNDFHLCFIAGTMIETASGKTPVEHVIEGTRVLTRHGYKPVTFILHSEQDVVRVRFTNGQTLTGTPDHPVWVSGKGFTPLGTLTTEDEVGTLSLFPVHPASLPAPAGHATVHNLTVADCHEYFANGILVANCDAARYILSYLHKPVTNTGASVIVADGSTRNPYPGGAGDSQRRRLWGG